MKEYEKYLKYKIKYVELVGGVPKKCNKNLIDINIPITIEKINGDQIKLGLKIKEGSYLGYLIIELLYTGKIKKFTPGNKPAVFINGEQVNVLYKLNESQEILIKERV